MKYTNSIDGQARCSINLDVRLTKEDVALLLRIAKHKGYKSIKEYLVDTIPMNTILWEYVNDDLTELNKSAIL